MNWVEVPSGTYRVGLSDEELEAFLRTLTKETRRILGGIPFALSSSMPPRSVYLSGFRVGAEPIRTEELDPMIRRVLSAEIETQKPEGFVIAHTREAAVRIAESLGNGLITDAQWEVAQRRSGELLQAGYDEWCQDYFDGKWRQDMPDVDPCLAELPHEVVGCPAGRFVLRGDGYRGLAFHPAMRWHSPAPGLSTGKCLVRRCERISTSKVS